jgi:predicted NAD/FAD-dependent oxidoreductase
LQAGAEIGDTGFDAIVLALPPAQAAPLLGPHRPDWARHAAMVPMQPCWTLMGIADDPTPAVGQARDGGPDWALARPATGALAWVLRSDARPGRVRVPGQAHWVAHARAGWSRRHLEQPPEWVRQQLQAELAETLGRPIDWLHSAVHRWRYAQPQSPHGSSAAGCWWDPVQRLGVCGDFFGGCGVEGAWQSAQSMALALTQGVDADADLARAVSAPEADLSRLSPRAVGRVT